MDNVIVAGLVEGVQGETNNVAVIKFDRDGYEGEGHVVWKAYTDQAGYGDLTQDVAVDSLGDVVAAGRFGGSFGVVKFDGFSGIKKWKYSILAPGSVNQANAVAIDSSDYIIATGRTTDFVTVKLDQNGPDSATCDPYCWLTSASSQGIADGRSVVTDPNGDVIAVGRTHLAFRFWEFTVLKLDSVDGDIIWQKTVNGTADPPITSNVRGWGNAVTLSLEGNPIAAGYVTNEETLEDLTITSLNSDGSDNDPIGELMYYVISQNFTSGIENALIDKLKAASSKLEDGNPSNDDAMLNNLGDFIARVEAQRGKKISEEQADEMVEAAEEIIAIYETAAAYS